MSETATTPDDNPRDTAQKAHLQISVGDRYRDELNNEVVEVAAINGNVATLETDDTQWRERMREVREKVVAGDYTPVDGSVDISAVTSEADAEADTFDEPQDALDRADKLGLTGIHSHDGGKTWMPGGSHDEYERAVDQAGEKLDECVESVMADNPNMSESDAYTICNAELNGKLSTTPDGVPDDYQYIPPDQEPPEGHDVIETDRGGRYMSPEPVDGEDDESGSGDGSESSSSGDARPATAVARDLQRVGTEARVAGGSGDISIIDFQTDVPGQREIASSVQYNDETGNYESGAARFGNVDMDLSDAPFDESRAKDLAREDWQDVVSRADPPDGIEADTGDFKNTALHIRVTDEVDSDEANRFFDRVTELVNDRFFPYDPSVTNDDVLQEASEYELSLPAITQRAGFAEGDAVRWSWQDNTVHGRVAEVRPDQATVSGNTITGDEGEPVYIIDEYDDRVEAFRRENVAKPESSLDASQKDLPDRTDDNYVNAEAWESLVTTVSQSDFTPCELDFIAREEDGILTKSRANEWLLHDTDPVVYRADIPDKYLDGQDESLFVPNEGAADAARKVKRWREEHGDEVAGGAPDGEGARRGTQLIEYAERGEPLAIEYWEEILNYHNRHRAQGNHELNSEYEGEPWKDAGYVSDLNWGSDAAYEQAQRVIDHAESVDQEAQVQMKGAVATEQSLSPQTITKANSNEVDLDALEGELREAVEADDFYIYGKASIEQWDDDDPPTYIQMDALESALERFFESGTAPGIISRHHQDIPVGVPVRSFEFKQDTTLDIGGDTYEFQAGDEVHSHVEDADGDGRPELWLAANISNDNEMGKKTRVLAAQGDLNGFSVTVHRNKDEMTQEGRVVTDCDLHAVTIGTDDQIKNPGSEFDVASFKGPVERVKDIITGILH